MNPIIVPRRILGSALLARLDDGGASLFVSAPSQQWVLLTCDHIFLFILPTGMVLKQSVNHFFIFFFAVVCCK